MATGVNVSSQTIQFGSYSNDSGFHVGAQIRAVTSTIGTSSARKLLQTETSSLIFQSTNTTVSGLLSVAGSLRTEGSFSVAGVANFAQGIVIGLFGYCLVTLTLGRTRYSSSPRY